jgi:hypothetical protein
MSVTYDIKQVTRYVLIKTDAGKAIDVAEFPRRDEAAKALDALNSIHDDTTIDGRPSRHIYARINGVTYKYGYISEGMSPEEIATKDAETTNALIAAITNT